MQPHPHPHHTIDGDIEDEPALLLGPFSSGEEENAHTQTKQERKSSSSREYRQNKQKQNKV